METKKKLVYEQPETTVIEIETNYGLMLDTSNVTVDSWSSDEITDDM